MTYDEIVKGIKDLTIQGAEKIAIAAVDAFSQKIAETKDREQLKKYMDELISLRETEPALRNALKYCFENFNKVENACQIAHDHFKKSQELIAKYGANKISDGMIVYTHCHSSTVEAILIEAHQQGKKFEVYNSETRPKFQGRITATNLAKAGIKVTHFVDSAGRTAMKHANLFLFGCDAITSEGKIFNKIGTEFLAEFANQARIPAYSCTNSWKFDPQTLYGFEEKIEERDPKEVWENPPAGVTIFNPAFEIIAPDIITGVITEIGIVKPETLVLEVQKYYPWMIT
ncbi:MAG: translation initiation factor, aIF-2BII family, translation initiation factor eIF-2B subunit delta [Candidatus Peregrinibacteria bacterium GW2011_GWF2_38_29]|nr:MAG: translation initiation factor, aIF-2BII family, translation initiation factor eIF-2B subunit delta [Candidatus Peregrinibacteria bacterium GW2011_GWF2_38_29]HBB02806.1 ribose 1,5-bisphosphate isomerase [Candidatus Peregrinibacteria bacterium]